MTPYDQEEPTQELPAVTAEQVEHWDERAGTVALILALALGTAVVVLAFAAGLTEVRGKSLSAPAAYLLSSLMGGALGAVATYLGLTQGLRLVGKMKRGE